MMPSSSASDLDTAEAAATRLAPARPRIVAPRHGGGNNRLYRVEAANGRTYALKSYPRNAADRRDRLGTEWAALSFLSGTGIIDVPNPVAADPVAGFALYEWIDGIPIDAPGQIEIDAALAFLGRLHGLRETPGAAALPQASEACLSATAIMGQIERRFARLWEVAADEAELPAFLAEEFAPLRHRLEASVRRSYAACGWNLDRPIDLSAHHLSPSDFGFHNALRRPDGTICFLDFEYFGWDDPVKLVADFLQHPGMALTPAARQAFQEGARRVYGADRDFERRLALLYPLFGLRWCMILLNEFLPERWQGRTFAGKHSDRRMATRAQLAKARNRLTQLRQEAKTREP